MAGDGKMEEGAGEVFSGIVFFAKKDEDSVVFSTTKRGSWLDIDVVNFGKTAADYSLGEDWKLADQDDFFNINCKDLPPYPDGFYFFVYNNGKFKGTSSLGLGKNQARLMPNGTMQCRVSYAR